MKKLLLFLVLFAGAACAMQSDVAQFDGVTPEIKAQAEKIAGVVTKQVSKLTPEQRDKAVAQATEDVKKIVNACGNDKKLLRTMLIEKCNFLLESPTICFYVNLLGIFLSFWLLINYSEFAVLTSVLYSLAQGKHEKSFLYERITTPVV